jgi:hypothetical protein
LAYLFLVRLRLTFTAYRLLNLEVPSGAPFELRPSPGKGWGFFATRPIKRDIQILAENPAFVIFKEAGEITEEDVLRAIGRLSHGERRRISLLRHNGTRPFWSLLELFKETSFPYHNPGYKPPSGWGLFPLHSRLNHSCLPNCVVPTNDNQHIISYTTRDIAPGEELTFCYSGHFKGSTKLERQKDLAQVGFTCNCETCSLPSGPLQQQ